MLTIGIILFRRLVSSFCIFRSRDLVFDLTLLQNSGFTVVFIKCSQFSGLLYFSCFPFSFSSDDRLVLTILSTSEANLAFIGSLTVPFDAYSFESSPKTSSSLAFEQFFETSVDCRRSLTWPLTSPCEFPAIPGWLGFAGFRLTHFISVSLARGSRLSECFHRRGQSWYHLVHWRQRLSLRVF